VNQPFERRLWTGRCYFLTDLRIAAPPYELALDDVGDVGRTQTPFQRAAGLSTIDVRPKDPRRANVVLRNVRRRAQLAALIELLATDRHARLDLDAAKAAEQTSQPRDRRNTGKRKFFGPSVALSQA